MDFNWLFDRPIAHRGLHDDAIPENSLAAFDKAAQQNFNIEIDVHVTTDGEVVVFHDDDLKRVCGVDKKVKDCSLAELKQMRLEGSEYTIPTLQECLDTVAGRVGILCEIKGLNPFDNTIAKAAIKIIENYMGNIALQSFNFGAVMYARKHTKLPVGELCTWASMDDKNQRCRWTSFMGKLTICKLSKPNFIAYNVKACTPDLPENKWLKKWSKKLPVLMWTVTDDAKIQIAKEYANNIIFEYIDAELADCLAKSFMPFACPADKLSVNR